MTILWVAAAMTLCLAAPACVSDTSKTVDASEAVRGWPWGGQGADAGTADAARASAFACSPAGIAAYADKLVEAARQSCTSDGVGAVRQDNYACMQRAVDQVNPPQKDASFNVVKTLLANNTQYPNYECTYFVQTVTAGVCGTPISPSGTPWTDYPLAHTFAGKQAVGYTWIPNDGSQQVQAGDIFVYETSGGDDNPSGGGDDPSGGNDDPSGGEDPGHIMIVAEVIDSTHFRIAEANELNSDGSPATEETGVVSNTRVTSLDDNQSLAGWFRSNAK
jgi:hypothetical protein